MNARPCEWSDLEIFFEVARTGTLAAAAARLQVDASTVHRRLGKLEAAVRTKLFLRSPRGFALSDAGQDLFAHAAAMDEQASSALRKVIARDEQPIGKVRVTTVDDLAFLVMPPIVASFREKHPRVTVVVDIAPTFAHLGKREADVALRFALTPPKDGDVVCGRVLGAAVGVFASRAYLKRHGRPKRPEDLFQHAFVRLDEAFAANPLERIAERHGDPAKIALRTNSVYALFRAIRAGLGIGLAPYFLAAQDKTLQRLDIPNTEPIPSASLYILVHTDMRKNARVRAFVEHTYNALLAQRPLFEEGRR